MQILNYIIHFVEFFTFSISLYFIKNNKHNFYYFFILFIFFAFIVDLLGTYYYSATSNTLWIYNLYTFFEFVSFIGIYYNLISEKSSKLFIIYDATLFYFVYGLSFYYINLQKYTVVLLPFFTVPFMFLYLKELLKSDQIINYKKHFPFWLTVGFLIYYLGSVPFLSLQYLVGLKDRLLFYIILIIVITMHVVFIFGLFRSKTQYKSN